MHQSQVFSHQDPYFILDPITFIYTTSFSLNLFQAAEHIHADNAKYPKKIIYNYTTPHLAVEAQEVSQYASGIKFTC